MSLHIDHPQRLDGSGGVSCARTASPERAQLREEVRIASWSNGHFVDSGVKSICHPAQGFGLLDAAEEEARSSKMDCIRLDYWSENIGAKGFFDSTGFRPFKVEAQRQV